MTHPYDRALSVVMWWDAFLSLAVALLAIVALPAVVFADLPRSVVVGVGVAAILSALFLGGCGVVTAVLIGLRYRDGNDRLPERLRLPLPGWMRPTLQDAEAGQDAADGVVVAGNLASMSPAEQHAHDAAQFTALIESAGPGDWDRPSPVKEWTARGVVEHLIEWLPGFLGAADVSLPSVDTSDLVDAWQRRSADVQQLLETQGDGVFEGKMIGRTTVAEAIDRFYTADIWMHSWDLARALGQQIDLGEERCAAALAGMEPIEQMMRDSGQFGPRVDVPPDASAQDQFIGFIGRDPYWQPPI